jgi:hypothetical protein
MGDQVETHKDADGVHRILVLAHEGLGGARLVEKLDRHQADRGSEVFVVVPALSGSLKQLANDDRDEIAAAQADLERLLSELRAPGRTVSGLVGDSDPRLALEDSLRQFAADEIIVVNPAESEMGHLEETSTGRALKDVSLPVSVVTVSGPASDDSIGSDHG